MIDNILNAFGKAMLIRTRHYSDIFVHWLLSTLHVQLFVTIISIPILVGWGLPISYITPFGTLLFSPVLMVYLWCALVLFATTLLSIPNGIVIAVMEKVSTSWLWMLGLLTRPGEIGFVCPPHWVLCTLVASTVWVVWHVRYRSLAYRVGAQAVFLFGMGMFLWCLPVVHNVTTICGKYTIDALYTNNKLTLIDAQGLCGGIVHAENQIAYQVLPAITVQTGAARIDRYLLLHPRQRAFEALTQLCEKGIINTVYVPWWEGNISWRAFKAYRLLRETLKKYGGSLHIIKKTTTLYRDGTPECILTVSDKRLPYGDATYPVITVTNANTNRLSITA